jgi:hypothetical protein
VTEVHVTVEINGVDGVTEAVGRIRDAIQPPSLTDSLGKGADVFVAAGQESAPSKTGALRESIEKQPDGDEAWTIGPNMEGDTHLYAKVQEEGGVHTPQSASSLVFVDDGKVWFVKSVTIPGTGYMEKAFEEGVSEAAQVVKDAITGHIES